MMKSSKKTTKKEPEEKSKVEKTTSSKQEQEKEKEGAKKINGALNLQQAISMLQEVEETLDKLVKGLSGQKGGKLSAKHSNDTLMPTDRMLKMAQDALKKVRILIGKEK